MSETRNVEIGLSVKDSGAEKTLLGVGKGLQLIGAEAKTAAQSTAILKTILESVSGTASGQEKVLEDIVRSWGVYSKNIQNSAALALTAYQHTSAYISQLRQESEEAAKAAAKNAKAAERQASLDRWAAQQKLSELRAIEAEKDAIRNNEIASAMGQLAKLQMVAAQGARANRDSLLQQTQEGIANREKMVVAAREQQAQLQSIILAGALQEKAIREGALVGETSLRQQSVAQDREMQSKLHMQLAGAMLTRRGIEANAIHQSEADRGTAAERLAADQAKIQSIILAGALEEQEINKQTAKLTAANNKAKEKQTRESNKVIANENTKARKVEQEETRTHGQRIMAFMRMFIGPSGARMNGGVRAAITGASAMSTNPGGVTGRGGMLSELSGLAMGMGAPMLIGGGIGLGTGMVAKELYDMAKAAGEAARENANLAVRLGITGHEAHVLSDMAKVAGIDINTLENGARQLSIALEEPFGAGKRAATALAGIGISTRDLSGNAKELGQVLLPLLQKLSEIPDTTKRLAVLSEVLGRQGKELVPMVMNMERLQAAVHGMQVSPETDATFKAMTRSIDEADIAWTKFKTELLAGVVAPVVMKISTIFGAVFNSDTEEMQKRQREVFEKRGRLTADDWKKRGPITPEEEQRDKDYVKYGNPTMRPGFSNPTAFNELTNPAALAGRQAMSDNYKKQFTTTDEEGVRGDISSLKTQKAHLQFQLVDIPRNPLDPGPRLKKEQELKSISDQLIHQEGVLKGIEEAKKFEEEIKRALDGLDKKHEENQLRLEGRGLVEAEYHAMLRQPWAQSDAAKAKISTHFAPLLADESFANAAETAKRRRGIEIATAADDEHRSLRYDHRQISRSIRDPENAGAGEVIEASYSSDKAAERIEYKKQTAILATIKIKKEADAFQDAMDEQHAKTMKDIEEARAKAYEDLADKKKNDARREAEQMASMESNAARSDVSSRSTSTQRLMTLRSPIGQEAFGAARAEQERLRLAHELHDLEVDFWKVHGTKAEQDRANLQAEIDLKAHMRDAEIAHAEALAEIERRKVEKTRELAGQVFDGLTSGKGAAGLESMLVNLARGMGRTVAMNAAQAYLGGKGAMGGLGGIIHNQTEKNPLDGSPQLTKIGKLLAGTPLGVDQSKLALEWNSKVNADNTLAVIDNNQKLADLVNAMGGHVTPTGSGAAGSVARMLGLTKAAAHPGSVASAGGSGGVGGFGSGGVGAQDEWLSAPGGDSSAWVGNGAAYGSDEYGNPGTAPVFSAPDTVRGADTPFWKSSGFGKGVGMAGAGIAGTMGAISGFSHGGAQGALTGLGSLSGAAGSIVAMAGVTGPAAPILAGVGIALGLMSTLLGDPKQRRAKELADETSRNKYTMPTGTTYDVDTAGNTVSYGANGQPRVTLQMTVYALDSQSIMDRAHDISEAVRVGINTYSPLRLGIQGVVNP